MKPSPTTPRRFGSIRKTQMRTLVVAVCYVRKGDNDKAIADFTEAIQLDPKNAKAYIDRGSAYINKGDNDKAIADCNEAIRLDPKNADAYISRGVAYSE